MNIEERKNRKGDKVYFYFANGRKSGERMATGIFIHNHPKNQVEKNHNKEALILLDTKKSELQLEQQAIGTGFIPSHKFKTNFLDYYAEFVKNNVRRGNRHLQNSFTQFQSFISKGFIAPVDITEEFCKRFRKYLLSKFTGATPLNYFFNFKQVIRAATRDNYWRHNPVEMVQSRTNPSARLKENLEAEEYIKLLITPCLNEEVKEGFIFSCYTGLRFVDAKSLQWKNIKENQLTTRVIQRKTGFPVILTLHPIAMSILEKRKRRLPLATDGRIFQLPSHDGCNKVLGQWIKLAGIGKHITWSCARLSFSILLQDKNVDVATVAYLMGHTTSEYVNTTYRRHRPADQTSTIANLPAPLETPYFLAPHSQQPQN
jgi:integrase